MSQQSTDQLIKLFNQTFLHSHNTELVRGEAEPIYLPASEGYPHHRIEFAHGFFASALHEISHWCIAGAERRKLVDFGYWYEPDGRSADQQREFEKVEVKPQAVEWVLSKACGRKFNISTDNLDGDPEQVALGRREFAQNVHQQVQAYLENGLPERAEVLKNALLDYYQPGQTLTAEDFQLQAL